MGELLYFSADEIKRFVSCYLSALNVPEEDAIIAADVFVGADLRGIPTHGINRLQSYLGQRLIKGLINPKSPIRTISETPNVLVLDGGNGLGQVIAYRAMERCINMAKKTGVALVTVRNSNHYGIAGYYSMMALPHDMIGISLSNTQPLVAPSYGIKKMIGTNPISVAVPSGTEFPFVLDMATSIVTNGTLQLFQERKKEIPLGWGINQHGELTVNPEDILSGGALLPLGGIDEFRGYKGYGLSLLVDLLTGVLSGSKYGFNVGSPISSENPGIGHFFAAIKIENFCPADIFKNKIDKYFQEIKNSQKITGADRIYIPGEKEYETMNYNNQFGLPLLSRTVNTLVDLAKEVNVPFNIKPKEFKYPK